MPSPRTAQRPMSFTAWEFIRGALLTYAYFLPLTLIPFLGMFAGGLFHPDNLGGLVDPEIVTGVLSLWVFMLLPAATWGLAALVPASLVALTIGIALRRKARIEVHAVVHSAWGVIVGGIVSSLVMGASSFGGADLLGLLPTILGFGAAVGLATGLGWWTTAGLALRRDARGHAHNAGVSGLLAA